MSAYNMKMIGLWVYSLLYPLEVKSNILQVKPLSGGIPRTWGRSRWPGLDPCAGAEPQMSSPSVAGTESGGSGWRSVPTWSTPVEYLHTVQQNP